MMTMTKSQTLIDSSKIKDILESIGYQLIDCGNHWRTSALYRNGDNKTAIQIYKNTGVWNDFVNNQGPKPIESLIKLTLKNDRKQLNLILKSISSSHNDEIHYTPKELIQMENIYSETILERLFPNYNFYKNKKISEETQKFFKTGLAGVGQMYRRMVFPIYNEHKQIIGFSGRKVDQDNDFAKWKHLGKRRNWIYPAYIPSDDSIDKIISDEKEVILVESIGDCMSLFEQGIKNTLVTFGLGINSNIISYLSSKEINKIIISSNNDFESDKNHGLISSIKTFISLSKFFNLDQLIIKLPPKPYNDFGSAHENGFDFKKWINKEIDKDKQLHNIIDFIDNNSSYFNSSDIKKFKKLYNEQF
jgi:hypothetical protein